mgnify:CR=1 FL=1
MGIKIRSGSAEWLTDQETSGSASSMLYSDLGPGMVTFDPAQQGLKADSLDTTRTGTFAGNIFTFGINNGGSNPSIVVRTELPAGCNSNWYVNCEVVMRHFENSQQANEFVTFAWAGRLSSGAAISATKTNNTAGQWTDQNNADYTANSGNGTAADFHNVGWFPLTTGSGQSSYPIAVPAGVDQYQTTISRFIKLSDFVNSGESTSSFRQGAILDIAIGREKAPGANALEANVGIAMVKVRYTAVSGS